MGSKEDLFLGLEAVTPALRRYARALCAGADASVADDIVQTAADRVAAQIRGRDLREDSQTRAAAYRLLTSTAREKLHGLVAARPALRQPAILHGLADLPFEERAVLLLVALEGFSYDLAAEAVGTSREAIVMRLMRARAALATIDLRTPAPTNSLRRAGPHLRVVK